MRPVTRGASPQAGDFADYQDARPFLISRLGPFCSYCERRTTPLHVEHIQPKGLPQYAGLMGKWDNFLLACVNCNSTKTNKNVLLDRHYLPDRDNTFAAFTYLSDGRVEPKPADLMGERTLALTGLNQPIRQTFDENGFLVATDRVGDRMVAWGLALESKRELAATSTDGMRRQIVRTAMCEGFFSIWMKVFEGDPVMRQMLVDGFGTGMGYRGFAGTAKDCFDAQTRPVTPRPPNGLPHGGKV
jgi:uncharacterized protein (TIGR02646 family)